MISDEEHLDKVVEALAFLLCSEQEKTPHVSRAHRKHHNIPPAYWDGFEVMVGDSEDDIIMIADHANDQPVWPIDYAIGYPFSEGWTEGSWQFCRVRTLDVKKWRGKLHMVTPRMVEESIMCSHPNGEHMTVTQAWSIIGKRARLVPLQITGGSGPRSSTGEWSIVPGWWGDRGRETSIAEHVSEEDNMTARLRIGAGLMLRRHYLWSVLMGEGSGPRARFVTDPLGVREAFRLRDIPPGKQRRAALLHWVKAHWRKKRDLSESERTRINAYLRGVWSYQWNGLRCQIEPSIEDLQTLTRADR